MERQGFFNKTTLNHEEHEGHEEEQKEYKNFDVILVLLYVLMISDSKRLEMKNLRALHILRVDK